MPFLNLEWTSNRIQFFGEVDLFSVLSGLLYRNEWSSISGILNNNKIYTEYYDFSSKKYSLDKDSQTACQWSKTELGNKIPKTNAKVVEIIRDDQINFTFEAYGLSRDQFNTYVEECKKRGYNVDLSYVDGFFSANSKEGYNIKAVYDEDDHRITAAINSPKANYK